MANPENLHGKGFDNNPDNINRKGRPKGKISLERALKKIMESPTTYIDPVTGQTISGHYVDKHLADLILLSQSSEDKVRIQAIKEINDRYAGKAKQFIEVTEGMEGKKYDFSKLTPEQQEEFDRVQNRYSELLSICEIPMDQTESGE